MENSKKVILGIDVSSEKLDLAIHPVNSHESSVVSNDMKGYKKILRVIAHHAVTAIVMEASGGYEQGVARFMLSQGVLVHIVNPIRIRAFAKSKGILAKTDRIDAQIISEYGFQYELPIYEPPNKEHCRLKDLTKLYIQLQKDQTRQSNRKRLCQDGFIRKSHQQYIRFQEKLLLSILKEMELVCRGSDLLWSTCATLIKQKGIGLKTAMLLLGLLPELGMINGKKIASLAGLAPFPHESGKYKKKQYIQGGRFDARRILYMPVMVAIQHDEEFKRLYKERLSKGKVHKVAMVSLMRKMLVRLNARVRDQFSSNEVLLNAK